MATRSKIQLPIVLGCVIRNDAVLLIRRFEPSNPMLHNKWELPGGKIEFGEDPRVAIRREIMEETGVTVNVGAMLPFPYAAIRDYSDKVLHSLLLCFECSFVAQASIPAVRKIGELAWHSLTSIESLDIQSGSLAFLEYIVARGKSFLEPVTIIGEVAHIELESIDRARNRKRGYHVLIETRVDDINVQLIWGRIPHRSGIQTRSFSTREEALSYVDRVLAIRKRHGYELVRISPNTPSLPSVTDFPRSGNSRTQLEIF